MGSTQWPGSSLALPQGAMPLGPSLGFFLCHFVALRNLLSHSLPRFLETCNEDNMMKPCI